MSLNIGKCGQSKVTHSHKALRSTHRDLLMETIYLKTLHETIATGNLSRAAENLCITPSTASRRIKFIEDHYGCVLLDRSGPVLVPTEAGRLVLDKAAGILALEHELLLGLKGLGQEDGILFCCTNSFGIAHLPRVFAEFMESSPDTARLKFYFGQPDDIVKGLRDNSYNLAVFEHCIHCNCFSFDEFITYSLPTDEVVFISSPALGINSPNLPVAELFMYTLYGQNEGNCSSKFLATNLRSLDRNVAEFSNHIIVDDLHMIINAVLEGNGIACLSRGVVEKHLASGRLHQHHVDGFVHTRKRTLAADKGIKADSSTADLMNCIIEYFKGANG